MKQKEAILRVCASCEWLYKGYTECPKCGFASYSAHYVYGHRAYSLFKTQTPWKIKKLNQYENKLDEEIYGKRDMPTNNGKRTWNKNTTGGSHNTGTRLPSFIKKSNEEQNKE